MFQKKTSFTYHVLNLWTLKSRKSKQLRNSQSIDLFHATGNKNTGQLNTFYVILRFTEKKTLTPRPKIKNVINRNDGQRDVTRQMNFLQTKVVKSQTEAICPWLTTIEYRIQLSERQKDVHYCRTMCILGKIKNNNT